MTLLICEIQKTKQVNKPSKIETDSQMHRTNQWLPVGKGKAGTRQGEKIKRYQASGIK